MFSAYYIIKKLCKQLHLTALIPTCCLTWAKFLQAHLNFPALTEAEGKRICVSILLRALPEVELLRPLHQLALWVSEILSLRIYECGFLGDNLLFTAYYLRLLNVYFYTAQKKCHLIYYNLCRFDFLRNSSKYQLVHYFFPVSYKFYHIFYSFFQRKGNWIKSMVGENGWEGHFLTDNVGYFWFSHLQYSYTEIVIHESYQCSLFIKFLTWIHSSENCATYYAFHMAEVK